MNRTACRAAAALVVAAGATAPCAVAGAAPTAPSLLDCGETSFAVDGFGRGQVLHVVGSTASFVVTGAALADGRVLSTSPAAADRPLATCTTTSPSGTAFVFTGFFTPSRGAR